MHNQKSSFRVFFDNPGEDVLVREVLRTIPDVEELEVSLPLHTARFRTSLNTTASVKQLLRQLSIISVMAIGTAISGNGDGSVDA